MRHLTATTAAALICMLLACAIATPVQAAGSTAVIPTSGIVDTLHVPAPGGAPDPLRVRVLLPPGYRADAAVGYRVLYLNDGQDLEAVALQDTLAQLVADAVIEPPIVVAIDMPADRLGAYGLSDRGARDGLVAQTRFGPVGAAAHAYSEWIANILVPMIDAGYRTRTTPDARTALGWSLGAVHALNLGWQYPDLFARVGAFSPSLWLAADREAVQRTRLAQRMLDSSEPRHGLKLFVGVGDSEETDDRDGDGVNDALDDVRDLVDGWRDVGGDLKGLRQLGYSVNLDHAGGATRDDIALYLLRGGRHHQSSWTQMLPVFLRWAYARRAPTLAATGQVDSYHEFASAHVPARNVDVWLPPGYGGDPRQRYPVLYMHDGQNVFDPALSYTGVDWDVDGAMTRLIAAGRVREAIVVGVWNTPLRFFEYMPRKPVKADSLGAGGPDAPPVSSNRISSDAYLRFLVDELKPFIDARYRTAPGPDDTMIMGSSMGGLISLYAAAEYPQVFGGVAAVSTHWPVGDGIVIDWLAGQLPDPRSHRIYYDHGSATLDAAYAPYQQRVDAAMRAAGYREDDNWLTRRFEGAEHNEAAWRARLDVPLEFLLGK